MSDKDRIAALEARIAALEARLAEVESRGAVIQPKPFMRPAWAYGWPNGHIQGPTVKDGGIPLP